MSTHRTFVDLLIRSVMAVLLGIGLAILLNTKSVAGDVYLDEIKTRTDLYQDVTVTGHNDTDVYITHSKGLANVKIKDLDPETLWRVGLGPEPGSPEAIEAAAAAKQSGMSAALSKFFESKSTPVMAAESDAAVSDGGDGELAGAVAEGTVIEAGNVPPELQQLQQLGPEAMMPILFGFMLIGFILYVFACFCFRLIVKKTGTEPGIMIWLPVLQLIPLLRAAQMSMLWFWMWISPLLAAIALPLVALATGGGEQGAGIVGTLSLATMGTSVLQLIASVVWCVKIVQARGKHWIWTVLLILPFTNLIAFLYLAFSSAEAEGGYAEEANAGKIIVHSAFSEA